MVFVLLFHQFTLILGLPFAFKQAGLMEGAFVLTLVAAGSVKAMLLLIECKYKCLSVLVPDLSTVRVSDGKGYTPVKNEDHLSDDDDKHNKSNNSTRYVKVSKTLLLMQNVAHSTRHSFRPKINNQPLKKFLSLVFSCDNSILSNMHYIF